MNDDADRLVITRRRKKYKFAMFNQLDNCYQLDEWLVASRTVLPADWPLVLEVGAGTGLLAVELAKQHPENFYLAIDIKSDRLYTGAKLAHELKLGNIAFIRSEVSHLLEITLPASVSEIWLTFSDPYPRKGDAKHRLTAPRFLTMYSQLLRPDGILRFKTDDRALFDWSLEQFAQTGWQVKFQTADLHSSEASAEAKILTSYERKFIGQGKKIGYCEIMRK
jgi:tRNA (guanine-N7-)-methyltransferase